MSDLKNQLRRLEFHSGFPDSQKLQCPVFTRNKFKYIKAVEKLCSKTLAIVLNQSGSLNVSFYWLFEIIVHVNFNKFIFLIDGNEIRYIEFYDWKR